MSLQHMSLSCPMSFYTESLISDIKETASLEKTLKIYLVQFSQKSSSLTWISVSI